MYVSSTCKKVDFNRQQSGVFIIASLKWKGNVEVETGNVCGSLSSMLLTKYLYTKFISLDRLRNEDEKLNEKEKELSIFLSQAAREISLHLVLVQVR